MANITKINKALISNLHELLYGNIFVLTISHPTTSEFDLYFKKDMFMKNNKQGYLHTVHYLINILNPNVLNGKHIWPVLNAEMEVQFRNYVIKYLNSLKASNKDTGIPLLNNSYLQTHCGYKFVNFMYRLSVFVLSEQVKLDEEMSDLMLLPPKAELDQSIYLKQVNNMKKLIDTQLNELTKMQLEFERKKNDKEKYRNDLIKQIQSLDEEVSDEDTTEIEEKLSELVINHPKLCRSVYQKLNITEKFKSQLERCTMLLDVVNDNKSEIDFKEDENLIDYLTSILESIELSTNCTKVEKLPNLAEHVKTTSQILENIEKQNKTCEELITEMKLIFSSVEKDNVTNTNSKKNELLSQNIRKIYEPFPDIKF